VEFTTLPAAAQLQQAMAAVRARGVTVELVETKEEALARVRALIPDGVTVMTGASLTLKQIGFEALLISGDHPWRNLKAEVAAEKDPARQRELRKQGTLADYFLGSVHAVAETGEIVVASATGSQLAPYAFSSPHVIWVAGAQKVTPTLEAAIRRVRTHSLPLEDERMKQAFGPQAGSFVGKLLIFEREAPYLNRQVTLLLVDEVLGA
jgi:L-lactate utilization protein LutC